MRISGVELSATKMMKEILYVRCCEISSLFPCEATVCEHGRFVFRRVGHLLIECGADRCADEGKYAWPVLSSYMKDSNVIAIKIKH